MFDGADRFSRPAANDAGLPTSLEKAADLLIASIAARARRQHADLAGRVGLALDALQTAALRRELENLMAHGARPHAV